jgi:hypothetical protein
MTGGKQWAFAMLVVAAGAVSPAYAADVPDELELTIDVLRSGDALDGGTVNRIRLPDSIVQSFPAPGDAAAQSNEESPAQGGAPYGWSPDDHGSEPGSPSGGDGPGSGWEPQPPPPPGWPTRPGG